MCRKSLVCDGYFDATSRRDPLKQEITDKLLVPRYDSLAGMERCETLAVHSILSKTFEVFVARFPSRPGPEVFVRSS
jgi:hypothetical protein